MTYPSYILHFEYDLLTSGRRCRVTNWKLNGSKNSFVPTSIKFLNNAAWSWSLCNDFCFMYVWCMGLMLGKVVLCGDGIQYVQYFNCNCCDGIADDVLFVVIAADKAFIAQSPKQISLSGTIKSIVTYIVSLICTTAIQKFIRNIRSKLILLPSSYKGKQKQPHFRHYHLVISTERQIWAGKPRCYKMSQQDGIVHFRKVYWIRSVHLVFMELILSFLPLAGDELPFCFYCWCDSLWCGTEMLAEQGSWNK